MSLKTIIHLAFFVFFMGQAQKKEEEQRTIPAVAL